MAQAKTKSPERDGGSEANDNGQPPANAITLTELAAAMQMDEDTMLQRLAKILCKRDGVATDPDEAAE